MTGAGSAAAHTKVAQAFGINVQSVPDEPPQAFRHIWEWFLELSAQRGAGFAGAEPLKYADILAWSLLTLQPMAAHETRLLIEIDNIFTRELAKKREADARKKSKGKR